MQNCDFTCKSIHFLFFLRTYLLMALSWFQMIVGTPAFHPKSPEEVVRMICIDGMRPPLKSKSKRYPPEIKE